METADSSDPSPYWNVEAINSQLSKDDAVFANLKACFSDSGAFYRQVTDTLEQIRAGMGIKNPLVADRNKEVRGELFFIAESVRELTKAVNEELMELLDKFSSYYEKNYVVFIKNSQKVLEDAKEEKKKTEKVKEEYFAQAEVFNKLQASLIANDSDIALIGTFPVIPLDKSRKVRKETYESYQKYCRSVKEGNAMIKRHENEFFSIVNSIEELEESRSEFYKRLLAKYIKYVDDVITIYAQRTKTIKTFLSKSVSRPDIKSYLRNFSSTTKDPFLSLYRVKFNFTSPSYEMVKLGIPLPEKHSLTDDLFYKTEYDCILTEAFNNLKAGNPLTSEEKTGIIERLKTPKDRLQFATFLQNFTTNQVNISETEAKSLLELCNHLLGESLARKEISPYVLNEMLASSKKVIVNFADGKKPFYSYLVQHDIWKEIDIWKLLIDANIKTKIDFAKERKAEKMRSAESEKGLAGIFSKVKHTVTVGVSKLLPEGVMGGDSVQWEAALEVLTQFCFYLPVSALEFSSVVNLYLAYVQEFSIPKVVLRDLVLKLMKCQKRPNELMTKDAYIARYTIKGQMYQKKKAFALSSVIKFIEDKSTLRNMLVLNRFLYAKLKTKVFRQLLVRLKTQVSLHQRLAIWAQILNIVRLLGTE
eukprot:TRINITY_DN1564_c0_g1_i5.p1 TRINITY_DN1564_c0_g1~~TRINITY_DN1564_c0_g1_i5.p1  ORF type:complete len:646 (+),score=168.33 TRINITY_DN1564_c0_g1_i5:182-2119(+)